MLDIFNAEFFECKEKFLGKLETKTWQKNEWTLVEIKCVIIGPSDGPISHIKGPFCPLYLCKPGRN